MSTAADPSPPLSLLQYEKQGGSYDEARADDGSIRPHWAAIEKTFNQIGPEGLDDRSTQIEQLIRENGLTFQVDARRPYSEGDESQTPGGLSPNQSGGVLQIEPSRPWQLATVPIAFSDSDWQVLANGLSQRVRILETILADLLGPQNLVHERIIPPELLWGNPRFYRAYHQLGQPSRAHAAVTRSGPDGPMHIDAVIDQANPRLHVTAFDIVRGDRGRWWVTGDRTRAPSGLGYLLENRIVLSRALPHLHRRANVRRLAPFFESLRWHFRSLAPRSRDNPRVALLTPGPGSYREFEDAYLARYLGYTLVQGRDLAVRGQRLNLKTLGGLLPIEVLWRHVSDRKCDPLELDPMSHEGCTGLMQMIREKQVAVANSLGAALAEMPALLPFLQASAKRLLGEEVMLPSVATYWCGHDGPRQHVLDNMDSLIIRSAYAINDACPSVPDNRTPEERDRLIQQIKSQPHRFVAQEKLSHSLTPVWVDGKLKPWHLTLRSFQLQSASGVEVLPGGLARVSPKSDLLGRSPTSGQLTQDCWVISDAPVDHETTLLSLEPETIKIRRSGAELPSRVAEHLFWLGRYVERCESIARLLRTTLTRLAGEVELDEMSEMPRLVKALAAMGQLEPDYAIAELEGGLPQLDSMLPASVFDTSTSRGLQASAVGALRNATAVRDRISLDAYRIFRSLHTEVVVRARPRGANVIAAIERLNLSITLLLGFSGLAAESLTRTHGWRFVLLGRRIERAHQTAELLLATLSDPVINESELCEAILDATDSLMTYRSRYLAIVQPAPTIDLLVTDESNPRSLHFQLQDIEKLLIDLPTSETQVDLGVDERIVSDLMKRLLKADPYELSHCSDAGRREQLTQLAEAICDGMPKLATAVEARYLIHTAQAQTLTGAKINATP
ncbi:Uncharacterized conserved protein, circularly permuted ATPgrasp superfamily [Neorhodopirellula lusitana]|uniref:Uncharacterized conserved protein, circularly permuted ATPgrasp superfamily n=1 Tax=Neorhodopirellula lusitana TaxID=445327 RepID=A0ABY1Q7W9_9BACT|nr:circularly permuted type 2 ATP-grasp protein [Neorhodopirellula lusitana]SMP58479.1 Uncharacterized conserved protein, circularly permuted ATPgrasp superfamily [Neorhodopirellula lusitana]